MNIKHNNSKFDRRHQVYLADKRNVVDQLIRWIRGVNDRYPFEAVEDFLKKHSPDEELWRRIVVRDLSIDCINDCYRHLDRLDAKLLSQASHELQPEAMKALADSGAEL